MLRTPAQERKDADVRWAENEVRKSLANVARQEEVIASENERLQEYMAELAEDYATLHRYRNR